MIDAQLAQLAVDEGQAHRRRRLQGVQHGHAGSQFVLGLPKVLLQLLLAVDVGDRAHPGHHGPAGRAHRFAPGGHPAVAATLGPHAHIGLVAGPGNQGPVPRRSGQRYVVGVQQL
ncbi:MAG: hypothetical protein ABSE77_02270 [Acidimicrobiales bacterium]